MPQAIYLQYNSLKFRQAKKNCDELEKISKIVLSDQYIKENRKLMKVVRDSKWSTWVEVSRPLTIYIIYEDEHLQ